MSVFHGPLCSPERLPDSTGRTLSYGHQLVDEEDIAAVLEVLRSDTLTGGAALAGFELGLEKETGVDHAIAVGNGTQALEVVYAALGVGSGVKVLVPANTFLATATAALRLGAAVEFADIDLNTGNLDVGALAQRLERGPVPDLITPVHFAGLPCDMALLLELKRLFGFSIVEDAAHALGGRYRVGGRWWNPGEHPEVDGATLSFHPVKAITCGEGGAILTQHRDVAARARSFRSHGVDPHGVGRMAPQHFAPMHELGTNARMSELQAALGLSQLRKLQGFRTRRAEIAARYRESIEGVAFLDQGSQSKQHAWHLFVIRVSREIRDLVREALLERGVGTQVHYHPVPAQPWFVRNFGEVEMEQALEHALTSISIPLHPSLTDEDVEHVIDSVNTCVAACGAVG